MIIDHTHPKYKELRNSSASRYNGAYFYSREIVKNIIPNVKTDRNWVTIHTGEALDHSIVFIHNNLHPQRYEYLKRYKDVVAVVGIPETADKVAEYVDSVIYLPLSVDVSEVKKYARKTHPYATAFVGRSEKLMMMGGDTMLRGGTDYLCDAPREWILEKMALYKRVYAVGRCAIEAKVLGCKVLPYDSRFPDPKIWKVLDNAEAVEILQKELDKIDGDYDGV